MHQQRRQLKIIKINKMMKNKILIEIQSHNQTHQHILQHCDNYIRISFPIQRQLSKQFVLEYARGDKKSRIAFRLSLLIFIITTLCLEYAHRIPFVEFKYYFLMLFSERKKKKRFILDLRKFLFA